MIKTIIKTIIIGILFMSINLVANAIILPTIPPIKSEKMIKYILSLKNEKNENINTKKIVNEYFLLELEEEDYVDDIPFDTEKIVKEYNILKKKENIYKILLEEEDYIDDIPFDTKKIVENIKNIKK